MLCECPVRLSNCTSNETEAERRTVMWRGSRTLASLMSRAGGTRHRRSPPPPPARTHAPADLNDGNGPDGSNDWLAPNAEGGDVCSGRWAKLMQRKLGRNMSDCSFSLYIYILFGYMYNVFLFRLFYIHKMHRTIPSRRPRSWIVVMTWRPGFYFEPQRTGKKTISCTSPGGPWEE